MPNNYSSQTKNQSEAEVIQKAHTALVILGAYLRSNEAERVNAKPAVIAALFNDAARQSKLWLEENGLGPLSDASRWLDDLGAEVVDHFLLSDLEAAVRADHDYNWERRNSSCQICRALGALDAHRNAAQS